MVQRKAQIHPGLPSIGFVRLRQIIGDPKRGIPPLIPVSKSTWWQGVREGRFPQPIKLSERVTVWRVEDIRELIESMGLTETNQPEKQQ